MNETNRFHDGSEPEPATDLTVDQACPRPADPERTSPETANRLCGTTDASARTSPLIDHSSTRMATVNPEANPCRKMTRSIAGEPITVAASTHMMASF